MGLFFMEEKMHEKLTIIGFVGKVAKTGGENPHIRISVNVHSVVKGPDNTSRNICNWYNITLWDTRRVDYYTNVLRKGDCVFAEGKPEVRLYKKDGETRVDVAIKTELGGKFRIIRRADPYASTENIESFGWEETPS
jgi:single-stranded DNA-binding protein